MERRSFTVRPAQLVDAAILGQLWLDMHAEEAGWRDAEVTPRDLAPFEALAARRCREDTSLLLVAVSGADIVGFYCGRIRGTVAEGVDLYVVPQARRRGVGTALVRAALDWYASRGASRLTGALRAGDSSRAFWATVWEQEPSRLDRVSETARVEWRVRSIGLRGYG
jgi:GNAT superfamily N-acetyltransferase